MPVQEVRFVQVAYGECHMLALAANPSVFAFGQGNFGGLGLGDCHNRSLTTAVVRLIPAGAVQISAGVQMACVTKIVLDFKQVKILACVHTSYLLIQLM